MAIRVLLADKQPLTAAGLVAILSERDDIEIVGRVETGSDLSELLEVHQPQLLIVDYDLPAYISRDELADVKKYSPETHILVISADNNKNSILQVLQQGIIGYLTKSCSKEEIKLAINAVSKGEKFYCHKIIDIIMEKHFSPEAPEVSPTILTARESEILTLLASGYSTQRVADALFVSPHTVHTHRKSIIKKLNIKSPTEFVIYAMDFGLIKTK